MRKIYSSNDLLKNLIQKLDFKIFIFDDPSTIGPQIKLREKSKNCEIDAILLYKNIFCLVGINKSRTSDLEKEIERFFEKLDKVDEVLSTRLYLDMVIPYLQGPIIIKQWIARRLFPWQIPARKAGHIFVH